MLSLLAVPAAAEPPTIEDVRVTAGPAVADSTSLAPMTTISSAQIARSGATSLDDLLEQIPALGSQGVNGNQNQGGYGEAFADLRNLNFDRTLVLVDGRRMVSSGIRTDEAVDLNTIPLALIDHIDILRDGSQPLYGSDAVAGAVNVVLKKSFDGVSLQTYAGAAGAGDGTTSSVNLTAGHSTDTLRLTFSLGVLDKRPVPQQDRDWAQGPIDAAGFRSGRIVTQTGSPATPGGQVIGPGIDDEALGHGVFRPFTAADLYNVAASQDLQGGLDRGTASLGADWDVTDKVTAFAQTLGAIRRATDETPPFMLGLNDTAKHPDGFVIPAGNPFNPFGEEVALERSVAETGALTTTTTGDTYRAVAGLRGQWDMIDWSLSLNQGESRNGYSTPNDINLTQALHAAADGVDWFGPGSLPQSVVRAITYTDHARSVYDETVVQADGRAPIVALPGGAAMLRGGLEARWETGATTVDPVTRDGDQAGPDSAPTQGGYATREAYLDLSVPLLADRTGVKALTASLGGRFTSTDRYGAYPSGQASLSYAPVPDLRLRGTIGAARRAPAITEAFGGITANFLPVTDPCDTAGGLRADPVVAQNCRRLGLGPGFMQTSPLIDVPSGGNPALHPEASTNETAGIVLTPHAWPGFTLAVDGWRYRISGAIDSLADTDPNLIPDTCLRSVGLSSKLCSLITRTPDGPDAGQIGEILALDENVGTIRTSGIDVDAGASWMLGRFGTVHLDGQASWLADYEIRQLGQSGFTQYAGSFPGLVGVGLYARWRGRTELTWDLAPWSFSWTGRCLSGGHVLGGDGPYTHAPAILYQDISAARSLGRLTFMAGIDDLADVAPPTLIDGITNTNTNTYDVVGVFAWARVVAAF